MSWYSNAECFDTMAIRYRNMADKTRDTVEKAELIKKAEQYEQDARDERLYGKWEEDDRY